MTPAQSAARAAGMLKYQTERISEPLTFLRGDPRVERAAVKNFGDLLRCMGDKPSAFIGDKEGPIITKAKANDVALRDEVYLQIMKQLNGNPSSDSAANGWHLFLRLVREAEPPSCELRDFIRAFLRREAGLKDGAAPQEAEQPAEGEETPGERRSMKRQKSIAAAAEQRLAGYSSNRKSFLDKQQLLAREVLDEFLEKHGE